MIHVEYCERCRFWSSRERKTDSRGEHLAKCLRGDGPKAGVFTLSLEGCIGFREGARIDDQRYRGE